MIDNKFCMMDGRGMLFYRQSNGLFEGIFKDNQLI